MLTPSKIKNHHFEAAGKNAYRAQSVDDFFDIVADSYEQMFKENGELVKKIGLLAERVEEYRNDEDNIRAALLTAQRMADKIMKETNEKSEKQLAEATENAAAKEAAAEAKAKRLLEQAQHDADMLLAETKQKAARMIEEATVEAKEQAVVARDRMIKTQAALDLVEKEADKFKRELLTLYTEHIELINKIPEVEDESGKEEEPAPEEPEVTVQAEETTPEESEEDVIEEIDTDDEQAAEDVIEEPVPEEDEDEVITPDEVSAVEPSEDVPAEDEEEDEISDSELERLGIISKADKSDSDDDDMKGDFAAAFASMKDKVRQPVDTDEFEDFSDIGEDETEAEEEKDSGNSHGFKFNVDSIKFGSADEEDDDEYYDDEDDDDELYDDEDDDEDDDDDDGGNFTSKFKGFFKR